jgi:hypothetical protein
LTPPRAMTPVSVRREIADHDNETILAEAGLRRVRKRRDVRSWRGEHRLPRKNDKGAFFIRRDAFESKGNLSRPYLDRDASHNSSVPPRGKAPLDRALSTRTSRAIPPSPFEATSAPDAPASGAVHTPMRTMASRRERRWRWPHARTHAMHRASSRHRQASAREGIAILTARRFRKPVTALLTSA